MLGPTHRSHLLKMSADGLHFRGIAQVLGASIFLAKAAGQTKVAVDTDQIPEVDGDKCTFGGRSLGFPGIAALAFGANSVFHGFMGYRLECSKEI